MSVKMKCMEIRQYSARDIYSYSCKKDRKFRLFGFFSENINAHTRISAVSVECLVQVLMFNYRKSYLYFKFFFVYFSDSYFYFKLINRRGYQSHDKNRCINLALKQ